jgi:TetR/AcrR family transcriptional repressor of uid operon
LCERRVKQKTFWSGVLGAVQHESAGQKRIVDAARHLYATKGFHRTSMAELAAAADVSVGLIYRLFTDKNALIKALVLEDSEAKEAELRALTDDVTSGRVTIEAGFEHLARHALAKGDEALSFDIMAEAHRNSDVADTIATLCLGFRSVVRELSCVANPLLTSEALDGAEVRAWSSHAVAAASVGSRDREDHQPDDHRRLEGPVGARIIPSRRAIGSGIHRVSRPVGPSHSRRYCTAARDVR